MSELSELFDRDPLKLTNSDLEQMIARIRAAATQHELGLKAPIAPRQKKEKSSKTQDLLKDLGLT